MARARLSLKWGLFLQCVTLFLPLYGTYKWDNLIIVVTAFDSARQFTDLYKKQYNQPKLPAASFVLPLDNLCYTDKYMQMDSTIEARSAWPVWAEFLRQRGLDNLAAFILEAAGPLTVLGAQALYLSGPLLRPAMTDTQRDALADMLENRGEALAFATFLREEIFL